MTVRRSVALVNCYLNSPHGSQPPLPKRARAKLPFTSSARTFELVGAARQTTTTSVHSRVMVGRSSSATPTGRLSTYCGQRACQGEVGRLSLIHISEPTRLGM